MQEFLTFSFPLFVLDRTFPPSPLPRLLIFIITKKKGEIARRREPPVWIIVITVTLSGEKTARQNRKCTRVKWISVMVRYAHRGNTHWRRQRENVINSLLERGKEAWQNGWKVQKNVAFQPRHPTATAMSSRCDIYFQRSSALVANCADGMSLISIGDWFSASTDC